MMFLYRFNAAEPFHYCYGYKTNSWTPFVYLRQCCSVACDSLQLHGLQHTRLPYPSLSPGVCPNSRPLNW